MNKIVLFLSLLFISNNIFAEDAWIYEEEEKGNITKYIVSKTQYSPERSFFFYCYSNNNKIKLGVFNEKQFINTELKGVTTFSIDEKKSYKYETNFNRYIGIVTEPINEDFIKDLKKGLYIKITLEPQKILKNQIYLSLKGSYNALTKMNEKCEI